MVYSVEAAELVGAMGETVIYGEWPVRMCALWLTFDGMSRRLSRSFRGIVMGHASAWLAEKIDVEHVV
jgi:hypothetical protein